jgi:flagellar biosynthetic protein FlhB
VWLVLVIAGSATLLSVAANAAQGGLVLSSYRLGLHIENINPAAGVKRLLPGTSLVELVKTLATVGVVSYLCCKTYVELQQEIPTYALMPPLAISLSVSDVVYSSGLKSGCVLLVIAVGDYVWSRGRFEESIRMTKQEVKEEGAQR